MKARPYSVRCWSLGTMLGIVGHGAAAAAPFDSCARLLAADSRSREASACFHRVAADTGRWTEAERRLAKAALTFPDAGWVHYYLAEVTTKRSHAAAVVHYRAALERFVAASDRSAEIKTRIRIGTALLYAADPGGATAEAQLTIEAARKTGDRQLIAESLFHQGRLSYYTGERLAGGLRAFREAEALIFPDGPYDLRVRVLLGLGSLSNALGRYDHAQAQFSAATMLARENDDRAMEAQARLNNLTTQRQQMEAPDSDQLAAFIVRAREALTLAEALNDRRIQAVAHRTLGDLLARTERGAAEWHYRTALACARRVPGDIYGTSLWALGRFLLDIDPIESKRLLDEALRVSVDSGSPLSVAYAWRQQMRHAWTSLPQDQAVAESLRALDAIETIRALQGADRTRAGVFSPWTLDYYWLIGTVLAQDGPSRPDVPLAFGIAERMRSRLLLDALYRHADESPEGAARTNRRQQLLRALSDAQRQLLDPRLPDPARAALAADVERLEAEEEAIRADLLGDGPATPAFASLERVEGSLASDEALLAFTIGIDKNFYGDFAGGASLLTVTTGGTRMVRVPDRVRLRAMVAIVRGLAEHDAQVDAGASASMYNALLREAIDSLPKGVTRLIIVPDGSLHHLPFAVLRTPEGRRLGERYEISVVPSATVWLHLKTAPPPVAPAAALVVADPLLPDTIRNDEAADERGWWPAVRRLGALPHARREGRAILSHVGGDSRLLMGPQASESAFKRSDVRAYRVVHFAAHSLVDEEIPERSAIFLAGAADGEDGLLQAREIADLPLGGQVVVLSACRSATGTVLAGEGVMGLSRAFLQAGARAVIGTLWDIRDDHAARFFDWFYRSLGRGATVGAALADARRQAIAAGMPASTWSSVTVIGDDTVVVGAPRARVGRVAVAAGAGGALFLIALTIWIARRRGRPLSNR